MSDLEVQAAPDGTLRLSGEFDISSVKTFRLAVETSADPDREIVLDLTERKHAEEEIDLVVCSHLHIDHCGWVVDKQLAPVFPNATVRVDAAGNGRHDPSL